LDLVGRQPERSFFHRANMVGKALWDNPLPMSGERT
jgi:hypothetical protein